MTDATNEAFFSDLNEQMNTKNTQKILSKNKAIREIIENEEAISIIQGVGKFKPLQNKALKTYVILTPTRVVFYAKKMFGTTTEIIPIKNVSSVSSNNGALFGSITIYTSNNTIEINNVMKMAIPGFVNHLNTLII